MSQPVAPPPGWDPAARWEVRAPVAPPPPAPVPVLPVVPRQYHEFWRAPGYVWWRVLISVLVTLGYVAAFFAVQVVALVVAWAIDTRLGNAIGLQDYMTRATPALFLANNVAIAVQLPIVLLLAWAISGQRPRWLSSVAGGFRWGLAGRAALVAVPLLVGWSVVEATLAPQHLSVTRQTPLLLAGILVTTPFQAAAEEYMMRGYLTRVIGSWLPWRPVGLVVAWLASATIFMLLHGAGDPWLNAFYFTFATIGSYLAWRTGGLEAGVVIHIVNNLTAEALLPFSDISGLFDRSAGTGGPEVLLQLVVLLAVVVGIEAVLWRRRREGRLVVAAAPGAALPPGVDRPTL